MKYQLNKRNKMNMKTVVLIWTVAIIVGVMSVAWMSGQINEMVAGNKPVNDSQTSELVPVHTDIQTTPAEFKAATQPLQSPSDNADLQPADPTTHESDSPIVEPASSEPTAPQFSQRHEINYTGATSDFNFDKPSE